MHCLILKKGLFYFIKTGSDCLYCLINDLPKTGSTNKNVEECLLIQIFHISYLITTLYINLLFCKKKITVIKSLRQIFKE